MKKKDKFNYILNNKGYISIEVLLIAGTLIIFSYILISRLAGQGNSIFKTSNNTISQTRKIQDQNEYRENTSLINLEKNQNKEEEKDKSNDKSPTYINSKVDFDENKFCCDLENPNDLSDYEYRLITDSFIEEELNALRNAFNNTSKVNLKAEIQKSMDDIKIKYNDLKGGIILINYNGNKTDLELPKCIDGQKVVAISNDGNINKILNKSNKSSEEIKENLQSIDTPSKLSLWQLIKLFFKRLFKL